MQLSHQQLSEHLGIGLRQIRYLLAQQVLTVDRDLGDNVQLYLRHRLDKQKEEIAAQFRTKYDSEEELARLRHHQANLAELEEGRQRAELMTIEKIGEALAERLSAFRAKLLSLPTKAAHAAVNAQSIQEIEDILGDYVREALDEVQNIRFCGPEPTGRDMEPVAEAPAQAKRKRVGRPRKNAKPGVERRTGKVAH